jgi:hypothetical protein
MAWAIPMVNEIIRPPASQEVGLNVVGTATQLAAFF